MLLSSEIVAEAKSFSREAGLRSYVSRGHDVSATPMFRGTR